MSTLTFYAAAQMDTYMILQGDMTAHSQTAIEITYASYRGVYVGSFSWSGIDLIGGTVTGYTQYHFGIPEFQISGASYPALTILNYVESDNALGLQKYALAGNDVIFGSEFNDKIIGWAGNDSIFGGLGNDTLDGGSGKDTMVGGEGDDTYLIDNIDDIANENASQGIDSVKIAINSAGTYTLGGNIEAGWLINTTPFRLVGNLLNNVLIGNGAANTLSGDAGVDVLDGGAGNDSLYGGAGNDYLEGGTGNDLISGDFGIDMMDGGMGNDTYIVDNPDDQAMEDSNTSGGVDTVISSTPFTLDSGIENLTLTGTGNINGTGNSLANTLIGNDGNNVLSGGSGVDTINGGKGNDTYHADVVLSGGAAKIDDLIVEKAGEGLDTLVLWGSGLSLTTASTLTLTANVESLNTFYTENALLNFTGNALNNLIGGNSAGNIIDGGQGADSMEGGGGDDTYIFDNLGDSAIESASQGIDTVKIAIASTNTYTLGANIENATLINAASFYLTGNALNNVLTGNAAYNALYGDAGNDTLIGGSGTDFLSGGAGNDTFVIDSINDTLSDTSGTDTVVANLAGGSFHLVADLENLTLGGTAALNGFGNTTSNTLIGNAAANTLDGGAGADLLKGGKGNDTYVVDNIDDVVQEELAGVAGGIDNICSSLDHSLGSNIENLVLTGLATYGRGNELANTIQGNDEGNQLYGGGGADTLKGGKGGDNYQVDLITSAGIAKLEDMLIEKVNEGNDWLYLYADMLTLVGSSTLNLADNIENLSTEMTGSNLLNLRGNSADNIINGNDAANTIDGGRGADRLSGGNGNDTYIIDDADDTILEKYPTGGIDTVRVGIAVAGNAYFLGTNVENAVLTSAVAYHLYGNELDNILTGNAANNTLNGDAGDDSLIGNAGVDLLYGGSGNDFLDGGTGSDILWGADGNDTYLVDTIGETIGETSGTDTVIAKLVAGTYSLGAALENLTLAGTAAINGSGNGSANTIIGNDAANILDGGLGADIMKGGKGNDTYLVDHIGDQPIEALAGAAGGIDTVRTSVYQHLGSGIENVVLTGSDNIWGEGNELANTIRGNDGNNVLIGFEGMDTLIGGKGNDYFRVNVVGSGSTAKLEDLIVENPGEGTDTLDLLAGDLGLATPSTIILGANIENLESGSTGLNKLNFLGNALNNSIAGNQGDNIIDGGTGADWLAGRGGNDTYLVDNVEDIVTETGGWGIDTVKVSIAVANANYYLGNELENAILVNTLAYNLAGNGLNNTLTGNASNNKVNGEGGDDSLFGGAGNDYLFGNIGNDYLDGGAGNDTLEGWSGNDTFVVDSLADIVSDSGGTDLVIAKLASGTYTLGENIENLTLAGTAAINGLGNAGANILTGNDAANILNGGIGADLLDGGKGNDTYVVDNGGDVVLENLAGLAGGKDMVRSSINFTLGANLEDLTLTGSNNINGYGNAQGNIIVGNDGYNWLTGNAGIDTLIGGKGNDTYFVDLVIKTGQARLEDTIVEKLGEGQDIVVLSAGDLGLSNPSTVTLGANLESLYTFNTGNNPLNILGNAADNALQGNNAANSISGGSGNDALAGLGGDDLLLGMTGHDLLVGDEGNDHLIGGDGNDSLLGSTGYDILNGGNGEDAYIFTSINGVDQVEDFTHSDHLLFDIYQFNQLAFTAEGLLDPNMFVLGTVALTASQHIIFDSDAGMLYYDPDGSGVQAQIAVANLYDYHAGLSAGEIGQFND